MPTPFMHLHVAEQIKTAVADNGRLAALLAQQWPAFYYGSVAADFTAVCNVPREKSHFYDIPPAPGEDAAAQMLQANPSLAHADRLDAAHAVFVAAYRAHLLLDLIWFREVLIPWFVQPNLGERPYRRLLHFTVLTYLDRLALETLPATAGETLAAAEPNGWLPFAPGGALVDWRDMVANQLLPGGEVETVNIFAARLAMTPHAFAANLADAGWMHRHVFSQIPIEKIQATLQTAVGRSIAQINRYLFPID